MFDASPPHSSLNPRVRALGLFTIGALTFLGLFTFGRLFRKADIAGATPSGTTAIDLTHDYPIADEDVLPEGPLASPEKRATLRDGMFVVEFQPEMIDHGWDPPPSRTPSDKRQRN